MVNYLQKVKHVISEKSGYELAEITADLYFEDDLNLGELEMIEIITDLEEELQVELMEEKSDFETVQDLLDALAEKLD